MFSCHIVWSPPVWKKEYLQYIFILQYFDHFVNDLGLNNRVIKKYIRNFGKKHKNILKFDKNMV